VAGDVYVLANVPVSTTNAKIETGKLHVSNVTALQTVLPQYPRTQDLWLPQLGDWIEFNGVNWDFLMIKGSDAGTYTVLWQQTTIVESGRVPAQL
jgi:hypothetical protein